MGWAVAIMAGLIGVVALWRIGDHLADRRAMARLRAAAPVAPARFDPAQVSDLPEPARRFLRFAIAPGAALTPVVALTMEGVFRLGDASAARELAMRAQQIHAAPLGFVWKMRAGAGVMRVSGSDSADWTRFWALGLIPVARVARSSDHRRSAVGRMFIEAVLWTPAALLLAPPGTLRWQAPAPDTARVILTHEGVEHVIDLHLHPSGRPDRVVLQRWSNENPQKRYQLQPFGGALSAYETHDGFTIPTQIQAGNHFGTPAYFPFFEARLCSVSYLSGSD